jgi:Tfp pilus assembly protein PilN
MEPKGTMRDINLIPPDAFEAEERSRRLRFWAAVNAAVLVVLCALYGLASWSVRVEEQAACRLDARLSELRGLSDELQSLRTERTLLGTEEEAFASLLGRTPDCSIVRTIAEVVVQEGWLTRIDLTRPVAGERGPGALTIEGHAGSFAHLARLMGDLESLDYVASVDLRRSQRGRVENLDVVTFEIACPLVGGPSLVGGP